MDTFLSGNSITEISNFIRINLLLGEGGGEELIVNPLNPPEVNSGRALFQGEIKSQSNTK